jgi:hypothetical protein
VQSSSPGQTAAAGFRSVHGRGRGSTNASRRSPSASSSFSSPRSGLPESGNAARLLSSDVRRHVVKRPSPLIAPAAGVAARIEQGDPARDLVGPSSYLRREEDRDPPATNSWMSPIVHRLRGSKGGFVGKMSRGLPTMPTARSSRPRISAE